MESAAAAVQFVPSCDDAFHDKMQFSSLSLSLSLSLLFDPDKLSSSPARRHFPEKTGERETRTVVRARSKTNAEISNKRADSSSSTHSALSISALAIVFSSRRQRLHYFPAI